MRCSDISNQLKAYLDGEVSALKRVQIRHHLHRCPQCAAQLVTWQRLNTLLSDADLVGIRAGLEPATGQTSADALTDTPSKRKRGGEQMTVRILTGAVLTGALMIAFLLLQTHHDGSSALEVGNKLGGANTWHLHGWKMQGGKQVPWDIWGRRTPFFCREQVGSEVVIDDGKQQVRLWLPDASVKRKQGVLLRTPATPDYWKRAYLSYQALVDAHQWGATLKPLSQNGQQLVFKMDAQNSGMQGFSAYRLYTINAQSLLPTHYEEHAHFEKQAGMPERRWVSEQLDAEYELPLPVAITKSLGTEDYTRIDTTTADANSKTMLPDAIPQNVQMSAGFAVEATPIGMDRHGRIYVRVRGWLGGLSLHIPAYDMIDSAHIYDLSDPTHLLGMSVSAANLPTFQDEHGRQYLLAPNGSGAYTIAPDTQLVVLEPLEPVAPDQHTEVHPHRITLQLNLNALMKRAVGSYLPNEISVSEETVMSHEFTWHLDLTKPTDPALLTDAIARLRRSPGGDTATLIDEYARMEKQFNAERHEYYMDLFRQKGPLLSAQRPFALRAIFWMQRSKSQAWTPEGRSSALLLIADDYLQILDKPHAVATLKEIQEMTKNHSNSMLADDAKRAQAVLGSISNTIQVNIHGRLLVADSYLTNNFKRSLAIQILREIVEEAHANPEDLAAQGKQAADRLSQLEKGAPPK